MSDNTRPRIECELCGMVEYCDDHLRAEFPPNAARKAMKRRHKKIPGSTCDPSHWHYSAGIIMSGRRIVAVIDGAIGQEGTT